MCQPTTSPTSACPSATAPQEPPSPTPHNNPGLVSDCEALLASRDTLVGTATLNWSVDYFRSRTGTVSPWTGRRSG